MNVNIVKLRNYLNFIQESGFLTDYQTCTAISSLIGPKLFSALRHHSVWPFSPFVLKPSRKSDKVLLVSIALADLGFFQEVWRINGFIPRNLEAIIEELSITGKEAENLRKEHQDIANDKRFFPSSMLYDKNRKISSLCAGPLLHLRFDYQTQEYFLAPSEYLIKFMNKNIGSIRLAEKKDKVDEPDVNFLIRGITSKEEIGIEEFLRTIYPKSKIDNDYKSIMNAPASHKQTVNRNARKLLEQIQKIAGSLLYHCCKDPERPLDLIIYDRKTKTFTFNYSVLSLAAFNQRPPI